MHTKKIIILMMICILLVGCSSKEKIKNGPTPHDTILQTDNSPPETLHPIDRPSLPEKMPDDFHFIYKYGVHKKNVLNTFNDTFTKDLIADGTVKIDLILTLEEQERIYNRMRELKIETYPESLIPPSKIESYGVAPPDFEPYISYSLTIQAKGNKFSISLIDKYNEIDKMGYNLRELGRFIESIIVNKDEYKSLPEISGGYQ